MTDPITREERKAVTKMLKKYSMVWRTPSDYFHKYEAALTASEAREAEKDARIRELEEAMRQIRGWREIDRETLGERLIAIEEICDAALSQEKK